MSCCLHSGFLEFVIYELTFHYPTPVMVKFPHNSLSFCLNPTFLSQGSSNSGRTRSFSLLPHLTPSSSPASQRHLGHTASASNIVTITHHKSPAAARRAKIQYPGRLQEVKEVGVEEITIFKTLVSRLGNQRRLVGVFYLIFLYLKELFKADLSYFHNIGIISVSYCITLKSPNILLRCRDSVLWTKI